MKNKHETKLNQRLALISRFKTGQTKAINIVVKPTAPITVAGGVSNQSPEILNAMSPINENLSKL
jgi:hypothetical protein